MKKTTKIILKKAAGYAGKTAKNAAVRIAADAVREATGLNSGRKQEHFSETIVMRSMRRNDREEVLSMMRTFYASDAVLSNGSDEIFSRDIKECISDSPYAEGFVFEAVTTEDNGPDNNEPCIDTEDDPLDSGSAPEGQPLDSGSAPEGQPQKKLLGYAMIAHSFSTEYGKRCIWIEDLYLKEEARGLGLASAFLEFIKKQYPDALHRLEAEYENEHAMEVYKHNGFTELPYVEMVREK